VSFTEAKAGKLAEVAPGDQIRARGEKNADGTRLNAEDVVFGTFVTKAGTITAINAKGREITIRELATNKPLTVKLAAETKVRLLPPMGNAGPSGPHMPQGGAPPASMSRSDIAKALGQMPAGAIDDLKAGSGVLVSSTKGAREDRVTAIMILGNANPFSPEYDRPGFGRVDIFTKPGSDSFRGDVLAQYNNQYLNARNPLLSESRREPCRCNSTN
jgi:hypothetical protein